MESKKIYIILVVVVLLAGGFFGYRHFNKSKDLQANQTDTFTRLTDMAQKSPRMGLAQMGKAIKAYHLAKKSYPGSLQELYPEYMPSQSFIDEIDWEYRTNGDNFLLTKRIELGGKMLAASIDASMKATTGTATLVAGIGSRRTAPSRSSGAAAGKGSAGDLKLPSGMEILAALKVPDFEPAEIEKPGDISPLRIEPRIVELDDTDTPSELAVIVGRNYLVWKHTDGHLGFGNVQYPHADRMAIAAQDKWFNVTRRLSVAADTGEADDTDVASEPALAMGRNYLVWKHADGHLGFGNVQYPHADRVAIAAQDKWFNVTRRLSVAADTGEADATAAAVKTTDDIDSLSIRGDYVAWKDRDGTIGFGNVQYPGSGNVAYIYVDGQWQPFASGSAM